MAILRGPGRGLHVHARRTDSDSCTHQLSVAALRHGGHLGGGLILTLGSFMIVLAGLDTSSAYGGIGSSRAVMVAILAEPTLILVFVGITLLAKAMLPFVVNHLLVSSWAVYWSPAHLFLVAAFFILLLFETDRMPIHSSTHIEAYMIDEGRILEYSGPCWLSSNGRRQ
jgi:formate hydrogenlyase subunit 4